MKLIFFLCHLLCLLLRLHHPPLIVSEPLLSTLARLRQSPCSHTGPGGREQRVSTPSWGEEHEPSAGSRGSARGARTAPALGQKQPWLAATPAARALEIQDSSVPRVTRPALCPVATALDKTFRERRQPDQGSLLFVARTWVPVIPGPAPGPISRVIAQLPGPEPPCYSPSRNRTWGQLLSQPPDFVSFVAAPCSRSSF